MEVSTMVRHGTRPFIVLLNSGYTIEAEIHDGPCNRIKNWDYAALLNVFNADDGKGPGLHAATVGELDRAMSRAQAHDGPCLIEVSIDPHDCSKELREWAAASPSPTAGPRSEPARRSEKTLPRAGLHRGASWLADCQRLGTAGENGGSIEPSLSRMSPSSQLFPKRWRMFHRLARR